MMDLTGANPIADRKFEVGRDLRAEVKTPLVSVIIPCYNHAHFLGEALESVLNQTYRYVEIVVVDDGSTDHTAEVAASYPGVRYVKQKNQGLSAARNTGIRESSGSYLVFLDADDRLLPTALEAGLRCFSRYPECVFVSGDHRRVASNGSILDKPTAPRVDRDHYLALLRGNYIGMHATVMYRRDVFAAVGGFDISLAACEDYDLYLRIARSFPVYRHDEVVAEYRIHDVNMSHNSALMLKTVLAVLRSQWKYAKADARSRKAYNSGIKVWKKYYGAELASQLKVQIKTPGEGKQAIRGAMVLMRYVPRWFITRAGSKTLKSILPRWLQARWRGYPPVGRVRFGSFRRVTPISRAFGYDRGLPIDRYYIENFLARHAGDIRGRVLEIGDNAYTLRFGAGRVTKSDVLHVKEGNPQATFVGDLAEADHLPSDTFDCVILTQTLHLIYDVRTALATLYRILKPGGVLLTTFPGISQIDRGEWGDIWYWSFTARSAQRLFEEAFPPSGVTVETHGNVLTAMGFLHGLAVKELRQQELDYHDPHYQVLIAVRAVKPEP